MTRANRQLWLATVSFAAFAAVQAEAQSVISFGDSLSDTGNLFAITNGTRPPSPPYFEGRFSNGPVFTELLAGGTGSMQNAGAATAGGLPIDPGASQNYAFGGARTDRAVSPDPANPFPPGIPQQIDFFEAQDGTFASSDIVTLYGGANNLLGGLQTLNPTAIQAAATGAAADIAASTDRLANLGAPTLVVLNLPDLGATPEAQNNPNFLASVFASTATTTYNEALSEGLFDAAGANPGTNVHLVDVNRLFTEIVADPERFGFTNTTEGCINVAACLNGSQEVQNSYLFFDGIHPTARGHEIFAGLVTDYLTAGQRAADAGSMSEVAFADRLAGESAVRDRARAWLAATNAIAQGADIIEPGSAPALYGNAYVELEGMAFDRNASDAISGYDYRAGTLRVGGDYRLSDRFLLGGAVSAMQGEVDESRLRYDTQSFSADIYGTGVYGPAYVTLSGGVAHFDFDDFVRQTAVAEVVNQGGTTDGFSANIGVEAGYAFALGALNVTPTLGLSYVHFDVDGFDENGAGANIVYGDYDRNVLYGAANLHLAYDTALAGHRTVITGRIGYEDALSDGGDDGIVSTIAGSPSQPSFGAFDDVPGRGFILGAGAGIDLAERLAVQADYSAGFGDEVDVSHIGSVSLSYRF